MWKDDARNMLMSPNKKQDFLHVTGWTVAAKVPAGFLTHLSGMAKSPSACSA